ncbi:MAG: thiamine diphosphokinase [Oscillospiraceae bacterium]|jgi:thiamine pyrophosphokinase|nr:thiamine diphosphokinase [Oscillospiraceae bacterium]
MSKICCIFGAGETDGAEVFLPADAFVIAADAGLEYLRKARISPDLIVGDFDSLGRIPPGPNVVRHSPEKDDTDMLLAVREALARGAERLLLYGGLGGRLDHEQANLQTLAFIAERGAQGFLIGRGFICTVIRNARLAFAAADSGTVSIFACGGTAKGVCLDGLKYPLSGYTLTGAYPLGVSNAFSGRPASVSVRDGALLVMWRARAFDPAFIARENI